MVALTRWRLVKLLVRTLNDQMYPTGVIRVEWDSVCRDGTAAWPGVLCVGDEGGVYGPVVIGVTGHRV